MLSDLLHRLKFDGIVTFKVRARPGASHTAVKDILSDGSVKIDIAAAPEDNAANEELTTFLANEFGVQTSSVTILSGATSRMKLVRISAS